MANRHKALGRNRGAWAANTFYVRGDVVYQAGAIYSCKADFTSGSLFSATNWDVLLTAALRDVGAPMITQSAGLPSFVGRLASDLHYDSSTGKTHVLTGVPGSGNGSDTFTRADGNIGAAMEVGGLAYTSMAGYTTAQIRSGALRFDGYNSGGPTIYGGFKVDTTSPTHEIIFDVTTYAGTQSINPIQVAVRATSVYGFSSGTGYCVSIKNGSVEFGRNFGASPGNPVTVPTGVGTYRVTVDNAATPTIIVYKNGAEIARWTDVAATPPTGTYVGIAGGGNGTAGQDYFIIDNLTVQGIGTLAWTFNEPIYLQAQVASGAVATGTHVLKPGIRVPLDTALREMVLRCDTAPSGAPITVQVERFNNGVSQGIIATASIVSGATVGSVTGLSGACAKGDMLRFNITSVGSATAGADLTASLDFH